ncbi:methyltransferase, TIGR04325 family [Methylomonas sp. TEB]|uniref:methyltransferase, TIGR04325 family n=1 Tax=Methylomonas sp. TEB TaxID=3398229 RepID=UPI0039F4535E
MIHNIFDISAVRRYVKKIGHGRNQFIDGVNSWKEASQHCSGYDADSIMGKVLTSTLKVKQGEAEFERDSVLFYVAEYNWPIIAGLFLVASQTAGRLNVLDFGGALGSTYFQNRKIFKTLQDVRWNIVEQAHYAEAGRTYIQDHVLKFYSSIDECLVENIPNVVLLSSVLQYLEFPLEVVKKLSLTGVSTLIIDRTPFSKIAQDKLLIQRVPPSIYKASYPMWVFSESAFMNVINQDWRMLGEITCPEGTVYSDSGFEFTFQGMLLQRRES